MTRATQTLQLDHGAARLHREVKRSDDARRFRLATARRRTVWLRMLMSGGKRSSTPRKARRVLPSAERRLRSSFPEVWAWYELLVAARDIAPAGSPCDESEAAPRRNVARR
jgi:hypothetical protein